MYRIPQTLPGDIDYTESLIKKYKAGEISAGELKSKRVPMGIYEQRKNHHHMLRVRCTGGLITPRQLAKVAFVGHQVSQAGDRRSLYCRWWWQYRPQHDGQRPQRTH